MDCQTWCDVFEQAAKLGVHQIHLSGGEPLAKAGIETLVRRCRELDLYVNLITSGIGLDAARLKEMETAGLDSIQLSLQSHDPETSEEIAGLDLHAKKLQVASLVSESNLSLTLNCVLHRLNIDSRDSIVRKCTTYNDRKIELANCQYHGWALKNISRLLPTKDQILRAQASFLEWKERLRGKIELIWVVPDFYSQYPKPCMGGWATRQLTISPSGMALPCPSAYSIDSLEFPNVRSSSLHSIWFESDAFNRFRGLDWMEEPCRSCERRFEDFGGCRCQAFAITGDAAKTDPVCSKSSNRFMIDDFVKMTEFADTEPQPLIYRGFSN